MTLTFEHSSEFLSLFSDSTLLDFFFFASIYNQVTNVIIYHISDIVPIFATFRMQSEGTEIIVCFGHWHKHSLTSDLTLENTQGIFISDMVNLF